MIWFQSVYHTLTAVSRFGFCCFKFRVWILQWPLPILQNLVAILYEHGLFYSLICSLQQQRRHRHGLFYSSKKKHEHRLFYSLICSLQQQRRHEQGLFYNNKKKHEQGLFYSFICSLQQQRRHERGLFYNSKKKHEQVFSSACFTFAFS